MRTIKVHAAYAGRVYTDSTHVVIEVTEPVTLPSNLDAPDGTKIDYEAEGRALATALWDSLPSGTHVVLLRRLLLNASRHDWLRDDLREQGISFTVRTE